MGGEVTYQPTPLPCWSPGLEHSRFPNGRVARDAARWIEHGEILKGDPFCMSVEGKSKGHQLEESPISRSTICSKSQLFESLTDSFRLLLT